MAPQHGRLAPDIARDLQGEIVVRPLFLVLNVGTATVAALIGAGGYGQPILTGIRLDDIALILQGAVPAAALALLVQGLFELIEPLVVPRGLRLK
jgi:osmoprotectant transport system substrate-binding protein/osmoprotectant transport system permease protein